MKTLHTCIRVKNLDASLKFYQEAFGFEEKSRKDYPDYEFTLVYLSLPGEDFELELTYNYDKEEPYDLGDGYGHLAIGVEDLEGTHEAFRQKGYDVTELTGLSDGSVSYFFVKDPDGYKTEVIQL